MKSIAKLFLLFFLLSFGTLVRSCCTSLHDLCTSTCTTYAPEAVRLTLEDGREDSSTTITGCLLLCRSLSMQCANGKGEQEKIIMYSIRGSVYMM